MLKIRVLIDNDLPPASALEDGIPQSLAAEHGLAFWIEKDGRAIIFDTGKSGAFTENAKKLNLDLAAAEAVIISHGHYDHGGGLRALAEESGYRGPLWTGKGFFDPKWSDDSQKSQVRAAVTHSEVSNSAISHSGITQPAAFQNNTGAQLRYLGLDVDPSFLESRGISVRELEISASGTKAEILPGVFIIGGFPRTHREETIASRFVVDRSGIEADDFSDEVALVIDMPQGLVFLAGCAHPGLMNMLDMVRSGFGKRLYAVFGGSHLVEADEDRINTTGDYLASSGISLIALGHCTGPAAMEKLSQKLQGLSPLYTGAVYTLG
ncbi:MBL fold metallo-hydrolase [Gracilinema caldarium]|uniref:MBL fold metallo-hydrolase n=1 Tax=Gracilinema caldarium TaxID=215591 RepID=UPI0026F2E32F|nr:MBL fold metallo-hydrolase [Gracilinema caldarium]